MRTGTTDGVGYAAQGTTTLLWGTEGLFYTFTVLRYNEKELVENIKLPNGAGIDSTRVQLRHGLGWEITVRDDTLMVPPRVGTLVTIYDGGAMFNGSTRGNVILCRVVESSFDTAPKQAAERVISVEKLTNVD